MPPRPQTGTVLAAARSTLETGDTVQPLHALVTGVRRTLGEHGHSTVLGGHRLRRLMMHASFCKMEVRTRIARDRPPPTRCPVCRNTLRERPAKTLDGSTMVAARAFTGCGYRTGRFASVPTRYDFHPRGLRTPAGGNDTPM